MQPINDYNDGSGYWYSTRQMPDGSWQFDIHGDDNATIETSLCSYPSAEAAIAAARCAITQWRSAL